MDQSEGVFHSKAMVQNGQSQIEFCKQEVSDSITYRD
jgi:hypothetical protein